MSSKAQEILDEISAEGTKLGDLRRIAKTIKRDHELALELWSAGTFLARQLAILILDKKQLTPELIDELIVAIQAHPSPERFHLSDWLMANQLMKDKKTLALIQTWENSELELQRRTYYYHQARLRWTGQTPPPNSEELLQAVEAKMANETRDVQWAMNFLTAQIGIFETEHRARCISIGERLGLYKEEKEVRGCTPNYIPRFIEIEVGKRGL